LELACVPRPDWMDGRSLMPLIRGSGEGTPGRFAFTEFFTANSVFKPVRHGTLGVIDGQHQYVFDLDTHRGALFSLADADRQRYDLAAGQPLVAARLRAALQRRFPDILRGVS